MPFFLFIVLYNTTLLYNLMKSSRYVLYFLFATILIVAIFLRFYNFGANSIYWSGDQGRDLLVARNILYYGHRTLVGPILWIPKFYTPPTYFYFLAILLSIGRDIVGTAFLFQLMNLVSLILLFALISKLLDVWAGLIGAFLFAIAEVMVFHARLMWPPHLVTFFVILALYFLVLAFQKRKALFLWISCTAYFVAVSIYPNSIPLAPFFFWQFIRFRKEIRGKTKKVFSYRLAVLACFLSFFLIYAPQIFFEVQNGFITLVTIMKPKIQDMANTVGVSRVKIYLDNFELLFTHLFGTRAMSKYSKTLTFFLTLNFTALVFYGLKQKRRLPARLANKYRQASQFIALPLLIFGSVALGWFRMDVHPHRSWAFLPFLFIILAFLGRLAFDLKNFWYKVGTLFLLSTMVILNLILIKKYHIDYTSQWIPTTLQVVDYVISDINRESLLINDTTTFLIGPGDFYGYNLSPILYHLQEKINYPIQFVSAGNEVDRGALMHTQTPVLYLICRNYESRTESEKHCMYPFLKVNPAYEFVTHANLNFRFQVFKLRRT
jgi:hypothetical protein